MASSPPGDMLAKRAADDGDTVFARMADGTRAMTFRDLVLKRNRAASALSKLLPENMMAGAVYSKNSPEWLLCQLICQALGLRFAPINWHLVADEIAYIVDDCDANVLFFEAAFADTVAAFRSRVPKVNVHVCMDGTAVGAHSLEDLILQAPLDAVLPEHSRIAGSIGYTGGTSGKPKGAVRTARADPKIMMAMIGEWGIAAMMPRPVQLITAPLYHAVPGAMFGMCLAVGGTFVTMPRFDPVEAFAAIARYKVNGFYAPPILLKRLTQLPAAERAVYDISSVKTIMSGGAACPTSVKQAVVDVFGPVLREMYGATELGAVAIMPPEDMLRKPRSCGKPAAGISIILLDKDRQQITGPNTEGEIYCRGFNVDGYHKQEEKTKEAKFEDYFSVGDIGYFDEEGFLYISDRKIDMIVSGGVNIYPAEVEDVLHKHPGIEDVAVFGMPDEEFGECVHACLKRAPGSTITANELLAWCDGKIGKFKLPRLAEISFHAEDFPRSEAGKIRKKQLKAKLVEAGQHHRRSRL
eukprot:TRINITY_DN63046_c0_g1_i1.p1 TRINITY_DN63046_c0_g1~~TRINITY_DN63046_c0_g1_i1.p1  ORF type:complete len:525 (+),score=112.52 TRINITY_DN63046_c0_g1_i1:109-1683(+)